MPKTSEKSKVISSLCEKYVLDVIMADSEILCANGDNSEVVTISHDDNFLEVHKLNILTKYYKTQIFLFECEDLSMLSNTVKKDIECTIFYFDSDDKRFLDKLKTLVEFTKSNNVELSALITQNLNKDNGLSYDNVMKTSELTMNIIDLNESFDTEGAAGYEEVLELLRNHIWSTVNISKNITKKAVKLEDVTVEEALNEYEELLNQLQHFKNISPTLCRDDVLKNAEDLADLFAKILNED